MMVGVIMTRCANVGKATWANIVRKPSVTPSASIMGHAQLQEHAHALLDFKGDTVKEGFALKSVKMVENAFKKTLVNVQRGITAWGVSSQSALFHASMVENVVVSTNANALMGFLVTIVKLEGESNIEIDVIDLASVVPVSEITLAFVIRDGLVIIASIEYLKLCRLAIQTNIHP